MFGTIQKGEYGLLDSLSGSTIGRWLLCNVFLKIARKESV